MSACARRQGQWSPQEAVLACINIMHRQAPTLQACPPELVILTTVGPWRL